MKSPHIYIRGLIHADHTVFCVDTKGQKTYYDTLFSKRLPYSSGQQVKRSILEKTLSNLNEVFSPVEFLYKIKKKGDAPKEDIALQACDPSFTDQLLGGYMMAKSKNTEKKSSKENKNEDNFVLKRRSPLSISAMRPIHPLLAGTNKELSTFDRSNNPNSKVKLLDIEGNELSLQEMENILMEFDKSLPKRKLIEEKERASGLFVYDIAIDLRRLFSVSTISIKDGEPEVYQDIKAKLNKNNWIEGNSVFGPVLICPQEKRTLIINALSEAILDWQITSNQSTKYSIMEPLAFAISDKAYTIPNAIRAKLNEDLEKDSASLVIDKESGADVFVMSSIDGYIKGETGTSNAFAEAHKHLVNLLNSYDYERQEFK